MLSMSRWMESSDHASSSVSLLVCDIASIILDLGLGDRFDGLAQLVIWRVLTPSLMPARMASRHSSSGELS